MDKKFFDKLREKVKGIMENDVSHGFDHVERVYNLAMRIAKTEKVDLDILKSAVLLHDVARGKENKGEIECHASGGKIIAKEILSEMKFPKEKISAVLHCIEVHRYSKNLKAEAKEAEILQDADRLDALGAITIARIFMYNGHRGNPLHDPKREPEEYYHGQETTAINHFYEKIFEIKPETFNTKEARKFAKERYDFVKKYVERFLKEWDGKL